MRTLEEKELLVNAICEYMPYEPLIANEDIDSGFPITIHVGDLRLGKYIEGYTLDSEKYGGFNSDKTVIYLRPMDSITKEEIADLEKCTWYYFSYKKGDCEIRNKQYRIWKYDVNNPRIPCCACTRLIDWLRVHLFDYRGLIKRGIAKPIGTEKTWVSTETLKEVTTIMRNTIEEVKKITEDGQKKNRRSKG